MGRRDELSAKVGALVAVARARRIRDAWADAAKRLGLEHTVASTLLDDVLQGVVDGVPVRAEHLPLRELRRLHLVIEADALGALPRALSLDPPALLRAYDRALELDPPPSSRRDGPPSSVYRHAPSGMLDGAARALLGGAEGDAMGAAARDGKIVYQHAAPLEDGATLAALVCGVAMLATTLARSDMASVHPACADVAASGDGDIPSFE